ncbi:lipoyl synthase [Leptospira kmetyi]|uniref:Lipoyl synthase n=1 Tax=Leptospira kmetyi TaxID=408139 RepID=A0A5F1XIQ8_9LEPT|nr:lipoyl synthase [Leptospira kmetyi]AYV54481.1 lipoyl synthase [Leptospira kmetyi]EQA52839.1 lipoyl synthase [Leptospira kmetyi serovar Malaysia str. Bejo-Iso9]TGK12679.1 lipoyl synthase [Leptospira kmetyi]TGK29353.1 lipoyl synthase [Leptospira kmetyi]TGL72043.1 lipoyl synthase [Leptospira kmetyi]
MNPLKKKPRTHSLREAPEKPDWLKVKLTFPDRQNDTVALVRDSLQEKKLNTVCESASCPNLNHCWSRKTATYMLGGDICTRRCSYCDVASGKPFPLDREEPKRIAESAISLGLKHVVITAVNRDDLEDGGASHFAETVFEIRKGLPDCKIELLIPDLKVKRESLEIVFDCKPDIFNHNLETVKRLFPEVAPQKKYERSLDVLRIASERGFLTKSGLILGMGETVDEVKECMQDLANVGVGLLTLGQYLQPTPTHLPVKEYVHPEVFKELRIFGKSIGFKGVFSGPLVRSSYHADEQISWNG